MEKGGSNPFDALKVEGEEERWMAEALRSAWEGYCVQEVPVGAVAVYGGREVARAYNSVEVDGDATSHAEITAMRRASATLGRWRLTGVTLYSTLEPCAMCAGAAFLARLDAIVYAAPDLRQGAGGSWIDLFACEHPIHRVALRRGPFTEEAAWLMRLFFQERREERRSG